MSAQREAAAPTRLGRYELITRIGQGGMAEVQLALQRGPAGFEKLVVVKLVHEPLATQKAFVDMLLDEARVAALVKHPNVVDIYDLGQADGRYFIAMEYLEGEPLLAVLRAGREGKRLDALSTGRLIADTAEGLDAAHELRSMAGEPLELVHHDISLGNIVVLYTGQVKLVDFGVAKATQSPASKTKVQGKFGYMAPEKLKGATGDRRSDIFSLGCVMWEALTLKRLFRGANDAETMKQVLELSIQPPSKVNGDVPVEYDAIVMRALDRDPRKRQLTAKEMAVDLEELLRKRGYGAKNDRVARYMQDTFKTHIEARKKLVQEVVSKGSASAEVVDAAFSEPLFANGSPITPPIGLDVGVKPPAPRVAPSLPPPLPPIVPIVPNAFTDTRPTEITKPPWEVSTETEITAAPLGDSDVIPAGDPADDATRMEPPPRIPIPIGDRLRDMASRTATRLHDLVVDVAHDRQKLMIVGIAGGVFLVIMVIAIAAGRGGEPAAPHRATAKVAAAAGNDGPGSAAIPDPPVAVAGSTVGSAAVAGSAVESAEHAGSASPESPIERPSGAGSGEHRHVPRPVARVEHQDPEALYREGVQAYVKGDSKGALALLQKARTTAPNHAPTWRVLGQVYEKIGDHGAAKNAFLRYLQLAPNAADAAQVRQRIDHL